MDFAKKSLLLTLVLGPIGLLYTTPLWALFLIVGAVVFAWTIFVPAIIWVVSIILGFVYVALHNNQVQKHVTSSESEPVEK